MLTLKAGLLFFFGLLHFWMRPFRDPVHNYVEAFSVVLLFILYNVEVGLVLLGGGDLFVSYLLDVVEVIGFFILVPLILRDVRVYVRRKFRRCCSGKTTWQECFGKKRSTRKGSLHEGLLGDMGMSSRTLLQEEKAEKTL